MAKSTGPALAIGGVTLFNQVVLNQQAFDWRIPIATGFVALGLAGIEHLSEPLAVGIAWLALVAVLFTRVNPAAPAPMENLVTISKGKL
jgi:hypothetical protein